MSYTMSFVGVFSVLCLLSSFLFVGGQYEPTWDSLDRRPLPNWFDDSKIGIFIHWGVFSVPSFGSEWFWWSWRGAKNKKYIEFMDENYRPGFSYTDFAAQFTAELFDPDQWADIFEASGAKYVVLTSKHHEGFTNWPSNVSWNWNSVDTGPHRDLVGDLAESVRHKGLTFGLYHSLFEWFHPLYLQDKHNKWSTQKFVEMKALPELYDIVEKYEPEIIWSDGEWEAPSSYWNSTEFIAWLYNTSPVKKTVVTNDRWGSETKCKHGGYYTCEDRYNPGVLQNHKWENCFTLDHSSWGYNRLSTINDYLTIEEVLGTLASTVSCGGNVLINVGPTHDGRIMPVYEERLRQLGSWLDVNGDAIYYTKPWKHQNDTYTPDIWFTSKVNQRNQVTVYAIVLKWPDHNMLELAVTNPSSQTTVAMHGYSTLLSWKQREQGGMVIAFPTLSPAELPCEWAWVLQINNLATSTRGEL